MITIICGCGKSNKLSQEEVAKIVLSNLKSQHNADFKIDEVNSASGGQSCYLSQCGYWVRVAKIGDDNFRLVTWIDDD